MNVLFKYSLKNAPAPDSDLDPSYEAPGTSFSNIRQLSRLRSVFAKESRQLL